MKQSLHALLLATVFIAPVLCAQEKKDEFSAEQIDKKIDAMMPKDSDFKFVAPKVGERS